MMPAVLVCFHHAHERCEAVAAHHAVGVEHDHVAVILAPTPAEIGDVAALALDPMPTQAIKDAAEAAGVATQIEPRAAFGDARIRIAGVAQEKEIEAVEQTGARDRFIRRPHPGEDARGVFVADRHDDRGAGVVCDRFVAADRRRNRKPVAALAQQDEQAGHRCPESGRNPRDQNAEQREDRDLHRLVAVIGQHFRHERGGQKRLREQQHEQHAAANFRGTLPAAFRIAFLLAAHAENAGQRPMLRRDRGARQGWRGCTPHRASRGFGRIEAGQVQARVQRIERGVFIADDSAREAIVRAQHGWTSGRLDVQFIGHGVAVPRGTGEVTFFAAIAVHFHIHACALIPAGSRNSMFRSIARRGAAPRATRWVSCCRSSSRATARASR